MATIRHKKKTQKPRIVKKPKLKSYRRKIAVKDPALREHWKNGKLSQNYRELGLQAMALDVEVESSKPTVTMARIRRDESGNVVGIEEEEVVAVPQKPTDFVMAMEVDAAVSPPPKPVYLSEMEKKRLSQMIAKHGSDVEKIFWDKRLNIWQWSRGEISRRLAAFESLSGGNLG